MLTSPFSAEQAADRQRSGEKKILHITKSHLSSTYLACQNKNQRHPPMVFHVNIQTQLLVSSGNPQEVHVTKFKSNTIPREQQEKEFSAVTCFDYGCWLPAVQAGPADRRATDVCPINHLVHTVISNSNNNFVLLDKASQMSLG